METKSPAQILEYTSDVGLAKVTRGKLSQFILAFFAGVFIAFASEGSNMAAFNLFANPDTYGLGKVLAGAVFGTGLMLVLIAGGELFTGNTLIIVGFLDRKVKLRQLLSNWLVVYIGNFIGSIFIAYMMNRSGLFNSGNSVLGGQTIKIAAYKTGLPFLSALFLGIMCNWLVCLAVWVSYASKDVMGKMFACFFIIGLFITSGFEHSVANMYYIPAGILAKANITKNLIPVTLGNIIGGSIMVGFLYWIALGKNKKAA